MGVRLIAQDIVFRHSVQTKPPLHEARYLSPLKVDMVRIDVESPHLTCAAGTRWAASSMPPSEDVGVGTCGRNRCTSCGQHQMTLNGKKKDDFESQRYNRSSVIAHCFDSSIQTTTTLVSP